MTHQLETIMGDRLPCDLSIGRNPPTPQRYGGAMRIEEEQSLSSSQTVFRNGIYYYTFNLFLFFAFGITLISCYSYVYILLFFIKKNFVVILLLFFKTGCSKYL